jgi:hypothetical protein
MLRRSQPSRLCSEGQIMLEQALFGVAWGLIIAGTAQCPRCEDEVVCPLPPWLPHTPLARPATAWTR